MLGKAGLYGFVFDSYWEDIGTVGAFWEANLALTEPVPPFNFYDGDNPIYTRSRFLPAAKLNQARMERTIVAGGAILSNCDLQRCVVGVRAKIDSGTKMENVVVMGADWFENPADLRANRDRELPDIGIGRNCTIRNAIIDKNARIGDDVTLTPEGKPDMAESEDGSIFVRDGVLVVTKNGIVPSGTKY
jgi:glucose-1-phosphate adenylyltransferase